jgi:3-oxoadipate enol-lactonase
MKLQINGALINVVESGNPAAPPVIFVHGFPFSHAMWHHQLPQVAKEFRAVAYDLRGLGNSTPGDGLITIEGHVDDLVALMDTLQIRGAVIVGLSMGGYICLRALERNPERFVAAVLCDTRSEADTNEVRMNRALTIAEVMNRGSAAFAENFVEKVFAPESPQRVPAEVAMIRDIIARTPPLGIARTLLALAARTDTTSSLPAIRIPTLILVGEYDQITPPQALEAMHERIPGSLLRVIPHAGHMSPLENPETVNRHVLEFLRTTYK